MSMVMEQQQHLQPTETTVVHGDESDAMSLKIEQAEASENSPSPADDSGLGGFDLEAQQKAQQRLLSSLGLGGFGRSPFNLNFLAALQGGGPNPLMQQQLLASLALGGGSPILDGEEDENENGGLLVEPEDLSIGIKKDDDGNAHNWSYEEQFKQLYELSSDTKRKEWLDDWLSFMHRIGKPVTRIPIMAKQVLDLYELYRLVIQHGGLVEIINKKLWREITKGLNLPSSITSAAFTLRTQYQKYLYDYECEKEAFSQHVDLQQAIDGNRRVFREGRRSGLGSTGSGLPLGFPMGNPAAAGLLGRLGGMMEGEERSPNGGMQPNILAAYRAEQMAMFAEQQRHIERAQRAAIDNLARQSLAGVHAGMTNGRESNGSSLDGADGPAAKRSRLSPSNSEDPSGCTATVSATATVTPSTTLKITSQKQEGQSSDSSMVVSMEINGVTYQGVLFALRAEATAD
ncbi:hypothetical protein PFISCL1PPCAC_22406 [Pristionchus fissidentatus]|uniref:Uncharacterized protein n=1 Tax=Pristionchus fissidentatus TaxID=1538716 RepID=A0AAV5WK73_9BILA|nr:hypothetical protein PFISCL1PPCAC_22406 [Pristionchus fissidentatus]